MVAIYVSAGAAGVGVGVAPGIGVGVGVGPFAMLLETPPQPENASSAKVNRVKADERTSNAEQRGMQNSFRGTDSIDYYDAGC
jgi:hypothetical protein